MKKFKFSLEPVLKHKGLMEKFKLKELAAVRTKMDVLLKEKEGVVQRKTKEIETLKTKLLSGMTPLDVRNHRSYINMLVDKLEALLKAEDELKKEEKEIISELTDLRKERKMIELLKEKRYEMYLAELKMQEDRKLDEMISFNESSSVAQGGDDY